MKYCIKIIFICVAFVQAFAQTKPQVEPPSWWVNMKHPNLQLMVRGKNIAKTDVQISSSAVQLDRITRTDNPNYIFIDLTILTQTEDQFVLEFFEGKKKIYAYNYPLRTREANSSMREGFTTKDVIYLVTPDRFANGQPQNDAVAGFYDAPNRKEAFGRHGGDLEGIIQHLDYIRDMGFTALWPNPVQENNQRQWSYHGYAITDFYKIDARLGSEADYLRLCKEAKKRGIKIIMDMVANHCGHEHIWTQDMPARDWFNFKGKFTETNHRRSTVQDPYVANSEKKLFQDGWFVASMPDLNQRNRLMANYFTQNTLWWIEHAGLQGIRMDTYSYPDAEYMKEWSCRVMEEYPNFNIVGEEWSTNPAIVAHWQRGKENANGYTSCLPSLMDFPLQEGLKRGLSEVESWNKGLTNLYDALANDFLYADPSNLVIFADNHDMDRFFTQIGEDEALFRLGMIYLFTMRGIPQLYYGTETLMSNKGFEENHGVIRTDFLGGWATDKANAFTGEGLTESQRNAQLFIKRLANWRKDKSVIHNGKLTHYAPKNGVYVYFRYNEKEKVMVLLNKNQTAQSLDFSRFSEVLGAAKTGKDVLSGQSISLTQHFQLAAKTGMVIEID